ANPGLLVSGALFETTKVNAKETSPTDPTVTILAGTIRVRGAVIQTTGHLLPGWTVMGGYTFLDAEITSSPNPDAGQRPQNTPRNSLRLFSSYDLTPSLTLGAEADYTSSRVPSSLPDGNGQRQAGARFWRPSPPGPLP